MLCNYCQKQPPEMFCKKGVLKNLETQENNCVGVSFNKVAGLNANNFIKKKLQVFFCEIYEIFKNTYFEEHLHTTARLARTAWDSGTYSEPCQPSKMECFGKIVNKNSYQFNSVRLRMPT